MIRASGRIAAILFAVTCLVFDLAVAFLALGLAFTQ